MLSTSGDGNPDASLAAFCGSAYLGLLFFATTRKYANLMGQPRVALLVASRSNRKENFHGQPKAGSCRMRSREKWNKTKKIRLIREKFACLNMT